ncbi:MAG: CPBP family intramembrane metalloprotease [Planctomycetes bacterium]|nr:CPBP family intramembrane metalloprotease [Planctomycetota bacterium]
MRWLERYSVAVFYLLAAGISAAACLAAHSLRDVLSAALPRNVLLVLAESGPSLAALLVVALLRGRAGLADLLLRAVRWRLGWRGFFFVLALFPLIELLSVLVQLAAGANPSPLIPATTAPEPAPYYIPIWIGAFAGPGEELGWRGLLQPAASARFGDLRACLLVALLWWLWHYLADPPLVALILRHSILFHLEHFAVWQILAILPGTMLLLRACQWAGGNVLPAILLHSTYNWTPDATSALYPPPDALRGYAHLALLWIVATAAYLAGPAPPSRPIQKRAGLGTP